MNSIEENRMCINCVMSVATFQLTNQTFLPNLEAYKSKMSTH